MGIYFGRSPSHASNVALILNSLTGNYVFVGRKNVFFGRYVPDVNIGIVQWIPHKKLGVPKFIVRYYAQIGVFLPSAKKGVAKHSFYVINAKSSIKIRKYGALAEVLKRSMLYQALWTEKNCQGGRNATISRFCWRREVYPNEGSILLLLVTWQQAAVSIFLFWVICLIHPHTNYWPRTKPTKKSMTWDWLSMPGPFAIAARPLMTLFTSSGSTWTKQAKTPLATSISSSSFTKYQLQDTPSVPTVAASHMLRAAMWMLHCIQLWKIKHCTSRSWLDWNLTSRT